MPGADRYGTGVPTMTVVTPGNRTAGAAAAGSPGGVAYGCVSAGRRRGDRAVFESIVGWLIVVWFVGGAWLVLGALRTPAEGSSDRGG